LPTQDASRFDLVIEIIAVKIIAVKIIAVEIITVVIHRCKWPLNDIIKIYKREYKTIG
jgi:hypothetical protein